MFNRGHGRSSISFLCQRWLRAKPQIPRHCMGFLSGRQAGPLNGAVLVGVGLTAGGCVALALSFPAGPQGSPQVRLCLEHTWILQLTAQI